MALTNEDLQAISNLLQPIKDEVGSVKSEVQGMKIEMKDMKTDIQGMKTEMKGMKADIWDLRFDVKNLQLDSKEVKNKVTKMELTVENEIRINIQRVAEGHLDLYRKLNECVKLSSDVRAKQELQDVYITMHDMKLRALA